MQQESPESQTAATQTKEAPSNDQSAVESTVESTTENNVNNDTTVTVNTNPIEPPKVPFSNLDLDPRFCLL